MGLRQRRRTSVLAAWAHAKGMRFSPDDPFDIPRRYADFSIIRGGHSPCVHNVTYGQRSGLPIRAFDFRYEVGHGTSRVTRHYNVLLIERDAPVPAVLMWNAHDLESAPLEARAGTETLACWTVSGDKARAGGLGFACSELADLGVSLQAAGRTLMLFAPGRRDVKVYERMLEVADTAIRAMGPGSDASRSPAAENVANAAPGH